MGWDEGSPADSDFVSQFPPNERAVRLFVRQTFGVDHEDTPGANQGKHNRVTLRVLGSDPSPVSEQGVLYTKTADGRAEVFYIDSAGNVKQLTQEGKLFVPLAELVGGADDNTLQRISGTWQGRTPAQTRATLVVGGLATANTYEASQSVLLVNRGNQSGSVATNAADGNTFRIRATGNITLSNPSNLVSGMTLIWVLINSSGSVARTLAYGSKFRFPANIPVLSLSGGATSVVAGVYNGVEDLINCSFLPEQTAP
jgi:hypothetical protein